MVLAHLAGTEGEVYGAQITAATGLRSGCLYPILARLERGGWLTSRWEATDPHLLGRPLRRYYQVTERGRAGIQALASRLPAREGS
ncbi:PadR family transcriptional regulator [Nonomuraea sp. MTCD27]|uniref:PadR family transcriptional regulator n=1 Tax=Nonomuraea sp. MTCD27 TaxID=1676747 RepID=UPI0035C19C4F